MKKSLIPVLKNFSINREEDWLKVYSQINGTQNFSKGDIVDSVNNYLFLYRSLKIEKKSVVLICLESSLDLITSFISSIVFGLKPAIVIHPNSKQNDEFVLNTLMNHFSLTKPDLLISNNKIQTLLPESILDKTYFIENLDKKDFYSFENLISTDESFLQFSSGTTGIKKGVEISVEALFNQISSYDIQFEKDDTIVSWLPLYHDMGLIACTLLPFVKEVQLILMSPFEWVSNPKILFSAISKYKGTHVWLPNFALGHLANRLKNNDKDLDSIDFSSLKMITLCSEPFLYSTFEKFRNQFYNCKGYSDTLFYNCYAMAENTFAISNTASNEKLFLNIDYNSLIDNNQIVEVDKGYPIASVGKILKNNYVTIKSDNNYNNTQVGEILIKSNSLFNSYFNNSELTNKSFENEYYKTGDLGFIYKERLYLLGRTKDVIIVAGVNYYPQDIEEIINEIPGVIKGRNVVFGVEDDRIGSEKLIALVEIDKSNSITQNEIINIVFSRLKVTISEVLLLEHMELLKSTSGKISRSLNKKKYELQKKTVQNLNIHIPKESEIIEIIKQIGFNVNEKVENNTDFFKNGYLDSFSFINFLNLLEKKYLIKIREEFYSTKYFNNIKNTIDTINLCVNSIKSSPMFGFENERNDSLDRLMKNIKSSSSKMTLKEKVLYYFPFPKSILYIWLIRFFGIRVGKNVNIEGNIFFKIRGKWSNIHINDEVRISKDVDIRNRENGKITLSSGVVLDTGVRIVAAREGYVDIGIGSEIGYRTIINSGGRTSIGKFVMIAGNCNLNSSSHGTELKSYLKENQHVHGSIDIDDDVWIGSGVSILMNTVINKGSIISSNSLVSGNIKEFSFYSGVPAKFIKYRN